jgi:two-component system OmpR family sensor kinase
MASLRARLVAGLLALTAVGLLVLAGVTYATQRSFLLAQVDQQTREAPGPVSRELAFRGVGPAHHEEGGGRDPDDRALRADSPPDFGLPLGTYGEKRDASGKVLGGYAAGYEVSTATAPKLPAHLPLGRLVTITSRGERYRVLATPDPFGSTITVVAVPLAEVDRTLDRLLLVEGLVLAGVLVLLGLLAGVLVRIGLLPLQRMGHTAGAIAGGDLSHRVESTDPRTEVGRLGRALNAMLDRLEQAFAERRASEERLRRFLADASHELRTPLASIRGYAELFRIGAAREPPDVEKAMRRIEDEAARMGVLVEDLLTLARLGEVREAQRAEVDLAALARDAVDDARATATEREIELRAPAPAVVLGDAHQLRQVLANLLGNALTHTPEGTPVEVTVALAGDEVALEVRDHGPGLPTDDPEALFERFWRAERGRERGKAGAGLGLAIVSRVVAVHGGRVSAADAPGGGASFVVRLPAAPSAGRAVAVGAAGSQAPPS